MKRATITVLLFEVDEEPQLRDVVNDLDSLQRLVGGSLEPMPLGDDVTLWCNEDGKALGLLPNRVLSFGARIDVLCGPFFLARTQDRDFSSLLPRDVARYCGGTTSVRSAAAASPLVQHDVH